MHTMTGLSLETKGDNDCLDSVESTILESSTDDCLNSGRHGVFGNLAGMRDILIDKRRELHIVPDFRKVLIVRNAVMTDACTA